MGILLIVCSLHLKFKQNMYVFIDLNKTGTSLVVFSVRLRFVKPVKHSLSSRRSVKIFLFTPVSPIQQAQLSSKILPVISTSARGSSRSQRVGYYRITEFYQILVSESDTSLMTTDVICVQCH